MLTRRSLSIGLIATFIVSACSGAASSPGSQAPGSQAPSSQAACAADYVSTAPLIHPYLQNQQKGFEAEAAAHGRTFQWLTSQEYNEQKQLELTETAIGSDCLKGITIITATPSLFKGVIEEAEKKVPVLEQVCHPDQFAAVCIEIDNEVALGEVAKIVAEKLGGKGNVVISMGEVGGHQLKRDIFINYWKKNNPDINVLGVIADCDSVDTTVGCAENALAQYPTMQAYVSTGFNNAVGAAQVFPKAGRTDIIVAGLDDDPVVIDGIKKGTVTLTLQQNPVGQGRLFFLIPYWIAEEGLKPIKPLLWIDTPGFIVDKSNVDNFVELQAKDTDAYIEEVKAKFFTK